MTRLQQNNIHPFDLGRTRIGHGGLALLPAVGRIWQVPQARKERCLNFPGTGSTMCRAS